MENSILTVVELMKHGKKIDEVNESLLRLMLLELMSLMSIGKQ